MSYAHDDERVAARLHRALETYRVPKALQKTHLEKISPIFRDVTELTAHHSLSEKIKDAVIGSRFLLVLCSPAAKASHWVNEEIKLFREVHGEGSILCALIEGTPRTSFPPALVAGGREPLAANLSAKNFNLGVSQLAASIIGVGLDRLIQRDVRRRRNRLRLMTAGAFAFSGVMAAMAWNAVDARTEAETSRTEAEKMVEYMLTDLKDDLEPIGKLDIVEKVGERVKTYYQAIPVSDMDDDRLARRSRSKQLLGQVNIVQGNTAKALQSLLQVEKVTAEILRRRPNDPDAVFTHAQTQYGLTRVYHENDLERALKYASSYKSLSQKLYDLDKDNLDYLYEYSWSSNKLGQIYQSLEDYDNAENEFLEAVSTYEKLMNVYPDDKDIIYNLITYRRNLALIDYYRGDFKTSAIKLNKQVEELDTLLSDDGDHYDLLDSLNVTKLWIQSIELKKLKKCNAEKMYTFTAEVQAMINHDPTDQTWHSRYITLVYNALQNCPMTFDNKWTRSTILYADEIYKSLKQKSEKLEKRKKWLDNYQAK